MQFLQDVRFLEKEFGLGKTWSYSIRYLDFEMYLLFVQETGASLGLSLLAVLIVVLIITSDIAVTLLVALCVMMTDLFLAALIHFWGLTMNQIVVLNIIVAIGTSVDYSTHIAYSYLITGLPEDKSSYNTPLKIRKYKAAMALRKMGSSVFHGGFSTFIAIVVLSPSKTYIMVVFFRLWFGIILFGMLNGFILLPVILTFVGPTHTVSDSLKESQSEEKRKT